MNWKKYANLFCNGAFQYTCNHHAPKPKLLTDYNYAIRKLISEPVYKFKLIARPISDLSNEEKKKYSELLHYHETNEYESPESFMYLLYIGVLPSNFDKTDIIFQSKIR